MAPDPAAQQPTSAADEAILALFKLVDQQAKIGNLWQAYEKTRNLPMRNRESIYLILYFALEKFIVASRPPVVKAQFTKSELRRYVRQHVNINDLGLRMRLIFLPRVPQSILLFHIATQDLLTYISTNLGEVRAKQMIASAVRGTMLDAPWHDGVNIPATEGMFHESSSQELIGALATIFQSIYDEVEKFFGNKIASSIVRKNYTFISEKYDEEILALYFEMLPRELLPQERVAFLNRQHEQQSPPQPGPAQKSANESLVGTGESPQALAQSREVEEKLREERDLVHAIIDSIGDGVFVVDRSGSIIMMNPIAARILGTTPTDVIGKHQSDVAVLLKNEKEVPEQEGPAFEVLRTGNSMRITSNENAAFKIVGTDKKIPIELSASPLWKNSVSIEEGLTGCVIVFRDVTEQRKLDDVKTNFLSIASHQLRAPLTAMRWFLEMSLEGDAGDLSPNQKDLLQKAYDSTERMSRLVNHLLQIVRVETNRLKIEPIPLNFTEITERIILTLQTDFKAKNQQFVVEADKANLPLIPMDYDIVWQVILNLLSNASRYSPKDGKIIIAIVYDESKKEIQYSIQDFGIGIPDSQKDLIFKKFFRANNALNAAPDGTGVGLWLAKALVENWGGALWFESLEGKGTTFHFTVPIAGMTSTAKQIEINQ